MSSGIKHMVIFTLENSDEVSVKAFLEDSRRILSNIPGVTDFEITKQVSVKNNFQYGFSMFFADDTFYQAYNAHPNHIQYVQTYWLTYVADFMEIDFKSI